MNRKAPWYIAKYPNGVPKTARRPVRKFSSRRRIQIERYKLKARNWITAQKKCSGMPGCFQIPSEVHHTRGRQGPLLLDERFWIGVCRKCHVWIHRNPNEARSLGLLAPMGQWNKQVK